ncbi:hypothetical protein WJX79_008252 [Trebouxia sp. C0005]
MAQQLEHLKWINGTNFMVDGFNFQNARCKNYFLTHFHSDHTTGLNRAFSSGVIYCSPITATLLTKDMGMPAERVIPLPVDTPIIIDGVSVTLMDANHCPGACMMLFKVPSKTGKPQVILHTGDMRWQPHLAQHPALRACKVELLYMDTTYCLPKHEFPSQNSAIASLVKVMREAHAAERKTLFVVGSYHIGKERAFFGAAKAMGFKIWCHAAKKRVMEWCEMPKEDMDCLVSKESAAQIHVVFMGQGLQPEALEQRRLKGDYAKIVAFRPTGWSYQKKGLQTRREGNVTIYGIPYSEHSSFAELRITGVAVLIWLLANVLCYAANENSWLSRVLHIPPLLCFTNGLKFADPQPETFWCFDLLDPRDLVKSFWLGSRGLLLLRIVILIYLADILSAEGLSAHGFERAYWMAYFTGWSFCLVVTSTVLGVAVSLKYLITSSWHDPSDPEGMVPAEMQYDPQLIKWSILEKIHCLVLQSAAVNSTAVLVFYWAVLSGSGISGPYPDDYLKHAMNAPIMLLDAWFSKVPFTSYHLQVLMLYGSAYELFMWIYYGASDHWVYNAVSWHIDNSVAVYVLLPLAYVILFFVWFVVATLRNYLGFYCGSQRLCCRCFRRCSDHVAIQSQKQEPLALAAGRLKKQSSNVVNVSPGRNSALTGSLDIIAHDTRYCGQQVLTTGRQTTSQSPDNALLMELSRRGSAPRQV